MDDQHPTSQLLIYQTPDGQTRLEVWLDDETVWLPQKVMAELFQTTQQNISQHVAGICADAERTFEATHKKFLLVFQEGQRQVNRVLDHGQANGIPHQGLRYG